jgi:hypothetical protein
LTVENLLGKKYIGCIENTTTISSLDMKLVTVQVYQGVAYIRHGDNHHMLLVVELPWLEVEFEAKQVPFTIWHDQIPAETKRIGDKLNNIGGDRNTRIS